MLRERNEIVLLNASHIPFVYRNLASFFILEVFKRICIILIKSKTSHAMCHFSAIEWQLIRRASGLVVFLISMNWEKNNQLLMIYLCLYFFSMKAIIELSQIQNWCCLFVGFQVTYWHELSYSPVQKFLKKNAVEKKTTPQEFHQIESANGI